MKLLERSGWDALSAQDVARAVLEEADGNPCVTCSFQAEDMVVVDILRELRPEIPVLFLETGYHFRETLAYRDQITEQWGLNLINLESPMPVAEQEAQFGILNRTDPARCCGIRKVEPLMRGLGDYEIWFTGLRREQSPTRANLQKLERHVLPSGKELLKVSILADWTWQEVWAYTKVNEIAYLPLYDRGYTSIGCEPCTALPSDPGNLRSGRWGGSKLECGIHTFTEVKKS